ncbi:rod shape-determining protein MreD [Streptococcus sp. CSL10205-OR2]|uniref:rod shape-determining protein MreD n=1 Tax=Streptococcus sp. CSL10205-OR2 TaxID=2980558 RepID=UPI0021DA79B1|nr:rod shape-determining protein MreD [Streptococcus sp. CSL10205-OR2]MCU9534438.1 rod shape-determining protein MreD [Streptococcus sp. CSL10205-OR2]
MKKFKEIFPFLFLFASLFLDRHLTYLISSLFSHQFIISSYFFLMMLLFFILTYSKWLVYLIFFVLSFVYDSLYFHSIGIATFLFPLLIFLGYKWLHLMTYSKIARVASFFILVFVFNVGSYFLAWFYHMTSYPFDVFVSYHLLPSLIINLFFFLFSEFFVKRLHLI